MQLLALLNEPGKSLLATMLLPKAALATVSAIYTDFKDVSGGGPASYFSLKAGLLGKIYLNN